MNSDQVKKILVIGDWVVDENLLVTSDSTPLKSHEGIGDQRYYSNKIKIKSQILSLCAAGGVTRMLHSLNQDRRQVDLYGLGCWEPDDTKYLATLCRPDKNLLYQTPMTLKEMVDETDQTEPTNNNHALCGKEESCLACKSCERLFSLSLKDFGTWRVQRIYNHIGTNPPRLTRRYDWEITQEGLKLNDDKRNELNNFIAKIPKIDVVVIVDHQKGSITKKLIETVANHEITKNAIWYIRTKNYAKSEEWLSAIKGITKLLFLGSANVEIDNAPWFFGKELSKEAIEWLIRKSDTVKMNKYSSVVVFHKDSKLAAIMPLDKSPNLKKLYTSQATPHQPSYTIGRATVLFTSLIAWKEKLLDIEVSEKDELKKALNRSYDWCKLHELDLNDIPFDDEKETNFRKHFNNILHKKPEEYGFRIEEFDLKKVIKSWKEALKENATVARSTFETNYKIQHHEDKFQIWRGWSVVEGYIAITENHKKLVSELVHAVKDFRDDRNPKRSLSSIISAPPGNGKSYLIEMMSKQMNMEYREFNIAQLATIEDLIDCFDAISSFQTQSQMRPLIIFWDEINSSISNQEVYSYFLGPIWNGVYRRGGRSFQLKPCVWIFAGTSEIGHENTKGSDFLSRINGPEIKMMQKPDKADKSFQIEQLYISVALLKRNHPNLKKISKGVLEFFKNLEPAGGVRSIDFIISKLKAIEYGRLNVKGLPNMDEIKSFVKKGSNRKLLNQIILKYINKEETYYRIYERPPY